MTILNFLLEDENVEQLKQVLPKVRFQNEEDIRKVQEFLNSIGAQDGWMNNDQYNRFTYEYPLLVRDLGGEILEKILTLKDQPEIVLANSYEFASDSLFCEWAYVIDFDKNTFEVYTGFNKKRITPEDRFFDLCKEDRENPEYYPVLLFLSFPLNNLPYGDEFIIRCRLKWEQK
ncbi:hypothetical protein [Chryseobacterium oryctis]|uniref:Immunity protein 22 n=1 Tax=Chryseobacterium oryctis TaxID=2952618 RepID=A0ABT3HIX7_9FLAO|nr:hypothetical protein [Chryseobacterium oryctis]MCW3159668.1 hypothetical protein [Chryseobacterium oryctis]